jgi:hypothetical protein
MTSPRRAQEISPDTSYYATLIRGGRYLAVLVWAIVFFVALILLVAVELNPDSGPTHHGGAPVVTAIVLFVGFGGSTWLMRRYFIKRAAAKDTPPALTSAPAAIGPAPSPRAPITTNES